MKKSLLGIMGISIASKVYPIFRNSINKVVVIRHRDLFGIDGHARQNLVNELVNQGIVELTGLSNLTDAWRQFFTPEDVIGMKINAINFRGYTNTPLASHYPIVCQAILSSCARAGIDEKKFIVWDRQDRELADVGFTPNTEPGKLLVMGTKFKGQDGKIGFNPNRYPVGEKSTRISRIMSDICTTSINVPVIKLHGMAGITIALKNHYGTIDNPWDFHENACTDPGIPEINALPVIRKKERLTIVNAIQTIYKEGNRWKPGVVWPYGGIILGTDPVAVDRVCLKIINEKRKSEGKPVIKQEAKHLQLSEELGIGISNLNNIDLVEIELI